MNIKSFIKNILIYTGIQELRVKREFKKKYALLKNTGEEAMQAYFEVAEELKITFVPIFGTLLGIYRENDFIQYDDDIDMLLDIKYLSDDLLISLKEHGFNFSNIFVASDFKGCQLPMTYKGLTCDIYFSYLDDMSQSHIYLPLAIEGHDWSFSQDLNLFMAKEIIIPFDNHFISYKFKGKEIKIPNNTTEILKSLYGEDFLIPRKNAHANPNVYQAAIIERHFKRFPIDFCKDNKIWDCIVNKNVF